MCVLSSRVCPAGTDVLPLEDPISELGAKCEDGQWFAVDVSDYGAGIVRYVHTYTDFDDYAGCVTCEQAHGGGMYVENPNPTCEYIPKTRGSDPVCSGFDEVSCTGNCVWEVSSTLDDMCVPDCTGTSYETCHAVDSCRFTNCIASASACIDGMYGMFGLSCETMPGCAHNQTTGKCGVEPTHPEVDEVIVSESGQMYVCDISPNKCNYRCDCSDCRDERYCSYSMWNEVEAKAQSVVRVVVVWLFGLGEG